MSYIVEELRKLSSLASDPQAKAAFSASANMVEQNLPLYESQIRGKIAEELRNFPDYPGVMKIAAGLVDGSYVRPDWDNPEGTSLSTADVFLDHENRLQHLEGVEIPGDLAETEYIGSPYSEVLDQIADSLDQIADALENRKREAHQPAKPKFKVVRKTRTENRDEAEAERSEASPFTMILDAPRERCGYLVEQYLHPLDKESVLYQVSKDGRSFILGSGEFEAYDGLDDEGFSTVMADKVGLPTAESEEGAPASDEVLDEKDDGGYWDARASQSRGEALGE